MRVLWITNLLFPDVCRELGLPEPVFGGWMYASSARMAVTPGVQLAVASVYGGHDLRRIESGGVTYYLLPHKRDGTKYDASLEPLWQRIRDEWQPGVVHIHGTEYTYGLAWLRACGPRGTVVSIQGLLSMCARYYLAGMTAGEVLRNITVRDLVRLDDLLSQKRKFYRWGATYEREYLLSAAHVIGRTRWDKAHVLAANPQARYHFCDETLRDAFYGHTWSWEACEKYSIFVSQAGYPLKGLHQMLKAMPLVLRSYPQARLYVAGRDVTACATWRERLRKPGYGKYIARLIRQLELEGRVIFTGLLDERQMCDRLLQSNVFVCPSSIENGSNSLGEAQLIGMPCIASYAGGMTDTVKDGVTGTFYRFEEVEMLAGAVCQAFEQRQPNAAAQAVAARRHDPEHNAERLMSIYKVIAECGK